jgi:hypothetical protein
MAERAARFLGRQVAATKLLLWHWSQPLAYLLILRVSFCDLDDQQVRARYFWSRI